MPGDDTEFFTRAEMVERFTLDRAHSAAAVFSHDKLAWINGMYLRRMPDDRLADLIVPFLEKAELMPDRAGLLAILPHIRERLQSSLLDAVPLVEFLFVDPLPISGDLFKDVGVPPEQVVTLLGDTHARWASVPFTAADMERELRAVIDERGFNRKHSMMPSVWRPLAARRRLPCSNRWPCSGASGRSSAVARAGCLRGAGHTRRHYPLTSGTIYRDAWTSRSRRLPTCSPSRPSSRRMEPRERMDVHRCRPSATVERRYVAGDALHPCTVLQYMCTPLPHKGGASSLRISSSPSRVAFCSTGARSSRSGPYIAHLAGKSRAEIHDLESLAFHARQQSDGHADRPARTLDPFRGDLVFRDAHHVPFGARLDCDVCIVGGGVAGLILAREFDGRHFRVLVVESGGLDFDKTTQELAHGDVVGEPTNAPVTTRCRQLGGTAHIWDSQLDARDIGFRCGPLDPVDFELRPGMPDAGWPFDRRHLDPYYERAQKVCGLGPYEYRAAAWASEAAPEFPVDDRVIETTVWQFGNKERFVSKYPAELKRSTTVTVLLHASVTDVEATAAGTSVTGVRVATLGGNRFTVAAQLVILATGGLENARLLLLSDRVHRHGLGNDRDLVGRHFMEHPIVFAGRLVPSSRRVFDLASLYDVRRQKGTVVMAKLGLTGDTLRREGPLNSCLLLLPAHGTHKPEAIESLKYLLAASLRGRQPDAMARHLRTVGRGLDFVAVSMLRKITRQKKLFPFIDWGPGMTQGAGWSEWNDKTRRFSVFHAYLLTEQPPIPRNRVRLGSRLDALGCRRLELDWQWDDISRRSVLATQRLLDRGLRARGFGRLDPARDEAGGPVISYPAQHHHLGTTRMDANPGRGVLDVHGRVHGVENLFVTGGSVFPTGGYINPTLTIAALVLRLADHVRERLTQRLQVRIARQ